MTLFVEQVEVPLKFTVANGEDRDLRRRSLVNPTFKMLMDTAGAYADGHFTLQWCDDENDWVELNSQEEWEECLVLSDWHPALNIRINIGTSPGDAERSTPDALASLPPVTVLKSQTHREASAAAAMYISVV
ncbi:hypothetical protein DIPPA_32546 [Diplonema papillatum]|nr:hypothetical protein DIPPA_04741 [Diplonema papillatum]KAJ9465805.1 hypothetical protein DIPPA_32546 [Diplonema papillatum]